MARIITKACRSFTLVSSLTRESCCFKTNVQNVNFARTLFTPATIGLERFQREKQLQVEQIGNIKEAFRTRMQSHINDSEENVIFSNDLKCMIYISETEEDIETTVKMMRRYHDQRKDGFAFSTFIFGPLILRMLHHLHLPDLAFELFTDESLEGLFHQMTSFQILMDLLYEAQKYDKVWEVSDIVAKTKLKGISYPMSTVVLHMAACAKSNTPEALEKAKNVITGIREKDTNRKLGPRPCQYVAWLCLNQGKAVDAYEVLATIIGGSSSNVLNNLMILALLELGRTQDVLKLLQKVLNIMEVSQKGVFVYKHVLDKCGDVFLKAEDQEEQSLKLKEMREQLEQGGLVNEGSLEEQLFRPVTIPRYKRDGSTGRQAAQQGRPSIATESDY